MKKLLFFTMIFILFITLFTTINSVKASPQFPDEDINSPLGSDECGDELYTAIGCIPLDEDGLIGFILGWAIGIAGGIALLLIFYAGIQIMTSAGDPKKLQAGKELLGAAIGGFLFLLFSVFVLEFIGVDLLEIPGF